MVSGTGYTLADTGGCSATHIIEQAGLGQGHTSFDVGRSSLQAGVEQL